MLRELARQRLRERGALDPSEEKRNRRCREDVNFFAEDAIKDKHGNPIKQAKVHREIQAHLAQPGSRLNMVEISRDHGKTTQSLIRLLWRIGNNPEISLKIVCENDPPAKKRLGWVQEQIEKNPRVHSIWPKLRPGREWSKTQIIVERSDPSVEPTLEACGVTTGATGGRADELCFDDPMGRRNALTVPALRKTVIEAIDNDWLNLLEPTSRASALCTGWTTDDWIAHAKASGVWALLHKPTLDFKSPWPEKWTEAALRLQLQTIGSTAYRRGFELKPLSEDIVAIPESWVRYWTWKPNVDQLLLFTTYDLSAGVSKSKKADFFATVTIGLDPSPPGTFYVLRAGHRKISVLQQILTVVSEAQAVHPEAIGIEATQYQAVLPELVKAIAAGMPPIYPLKPRVSKDLRLALVAPQLELGRVLFRPSLNPKAIKDPERKGDLVTELTSFPLGAHDDLVDAFVYAMLMALEYLLAHVGETSDDFDTPLREDLGVASPEVSGPRIYTGDGVTDRLLRAWGE